MSECGGLWHPAFQYSYWAHGLNKDTEGPTCPVSHLVPTFKLQRTCILHPMLFALPPLKLPFPLSSFPPRDVLRTRRWVVSEQDAPLLSS